MLKLVGWLATIVSLSFLIWQAATPDPLWPRAISAFFLGAVSLLGGLRIGADSAAAYTTDLQRLNKVLVDQNRELEAANQILLKQVCADAESASKTA